MKKLLALLLCLTLFLSLAPTALAEGSASKGSPPAAIQALFSAAIRKRVPAADREKTASAAESTGASADKSKDAVANKVKDAAAGQNKTPAPSQEKTPAPSQEKTPAASQDKTPAASQDKIPAASQDKIPAASKDKIPAASQDKTPAATQDKIPAATQDKTPAATQDKIPAASKDKTPAASQDKIPAASQDKIPAASQDKIPAASQDKTPAASQDKTPAASQEKTPAASQDKIPAASQSKGPAITKQPEDLAVVCDKTATISITASGKNLKYQWQTEVNGDWVNSTFSTADKPALSFTAASKFDGSRYRCIVTGDEGSSTSDAVTLSIIYMPVITKQPHNVEAREDEIAQVGLEATGTDLQYQWQTIVNGVWRDSKDEGADTPAITLEGVAENKGRTFRCIISNAGGSITSNVVVFSVKLRDEEALEQLQVLSYNKDYEGVIRSAEEYYKDIPMKERDPKLLEACIHAYVQQAAKLSFAKQNEAAEKLLESCIETYRGTAAVKEAETALNNLENSLKRDEPASGTLLAESARGGGNLSELTVKAGDMPVLVKVENTENSSRYVLMYVRAGQKGTVNMQDGHYRVKYATGPRWYCREELFGSPTSYFGPSDGDMLITYEEIKSNGKRVYRGLVIDLSGPLPTAVGSINGSSVDMEAEDYFTEIDPRDF